MVETNVMVDKIIPNEDQEDQELNKLEEKEGKEMTEANTEGSDVDDDDAYLEDNDIDYEEGDEELELKGDELDEINDILEDNEESESNDAEKSANISEAKNTTPQEVDEDVEMDEVKDQEEDQDDMMEEENIGPVEASRKSYEVDQKLWDLEKDNLIIKLEEEREEVNRVREELDCERFKFDHEKEKVEEERSKLDKERLDMVQERAGSRLQSKLLEERIRSLEAQLNNKGNTNINIKSEKVGSDFQTKKLRDYEDIVRVLELSTKEAIVKVAEARQALAAKDDLLLQHQAWRNRYTYKLNYFEDKCKQQDKDLLLKMNLIETRFGKKEVGDALKKKPSTNPEPQKLKDSQDSLGKLAQNQPQTKTELPGLQIKPETKTVPPGPPELSGLQSKPETNTVPPPELPGLQIKKESITKSEPSEAPVHQEPRSTSELKLPPGISVTESMDE